MGLGTKNRMRQNAELCREHLRAGFAAQRELVEEFIGEVEAADGDGAWAQFEDVSRRRGAMLERVEAAFREWLG